MPVRQRRVDRGVARGRAIVFALCSELETGRVGAGLSFSDLGAAVGLSGQQAARICRGQSKDVSIVRLSGLLAAVGLDLSARAFPGGLPVRDAAHISLLARFRARIPATVAWHAESPVVGSTSSSHESSPGVLDRRAWDAVIEGAGWRVGVEAETGLSDLQALERRIALKQRDGDVVAVLLVVNDTAHNRRIVADAGARLREQFPGTAHMAFRLLAAGEPPAKNTILVL